MKRLDKKISISTPSFEGNERKYLLDCIDSGWISSQGSYIKKFEEAMAKRCNRKYAVAVSSGTAALDISMKVLGISKEDEVITSDFSIISCTNAIIKNQGTPILVDSSKNDFNINVEDIEEKLTPKTKAILVPHIYGLPADMEKIQEIARKHDLRIIEDAAEMHGQTYNNNPCGSFGCVSIFSFYVNKLVTTGEGGMLLTDDEKIYKKACSLRNHSFMEGRRFVHDDIGFNYRMTNIQAAIGLAQVEQLDSFVNRKREIGLQYIEKLKHLKCLTLPIIKNDHAENIFWSFSVVINNAAVKAEEVIKKLASLNIEAKEMFWPLHDQPIYKEKKIFNESNSSYPNSKYFSEYGLNLPAGVNLSNTEIDSISSALTEILKDYE